MCGIVGYLGRKLAVPLVLEGLRRVEYRGYDSAGLAILETAGLRIVKRTDPERGRSVQMLSEAVGLLELSGQAGLGHTRWATHGDITESNAHPHVDCREHIAVAHNGQLANSQALRSELESRGHVFRSDTDTECIAHLIEEFRRAGDDLMTAARKTARFIQAGAFAFVALDRARPDQMVGACLGSELYLGIAPHGQFLASDHRAFARETKDYLVVEDGQVALINRDQTREIVTFDNLPVEPELEKLYYELGEIERAPFETFMECEIHAQAAMIPRILEGRVTPSGQIRLGGIGRNPAFQDFVRDRMRRLLFIGCGTSKSAGDILERFAMAQGFDARCVNAGEYCTSPLAVGPDTLVVPISQSGTTREVLAGTAKAQAAGAVIWPMVNVPGSRLSRFGRGVTALEPRRGMYLQAGLETGVASTKAFTAQILNGTLLIYALADLQGRVSGLEVRGFCDQALLVSESIGRILAQADRYQAIGSTMSEAPCCIYIGKGYGMAVAEEGGLKFKEIVYTPTISTSASDLKHGPIAMLDERTWVVAVCLPDPDFPEIQEWTLSNISQVLARRGRVVVVAEEGDQSVDELSAGRHRPHAILRIPPLSGPLGAMVAVIPLQLIAVGAARHLGRPIDRPRNLAKSATVF